MKTLSKRAREVTKLTQEDFAVHIGVSKATIKAWDSGRRAPSGAARTLLLVILKLPDALNRIKKARLP